MYLYFMLLTIVVSNNNSISLRFNLVAPWRRVAISVKMPHFQIEALQTDRALEKSLIALSEINSESEASQLLRGFSTVSFALDATLYCRRTHLVAIPVLRQSGDRAGRM